MAKRFTETCKWADRWYRALPPYEKLGWQYLLDSCDASGVIDLDRQLGDFQVGTSVDWDSLIKSAGDRIEVIKKGKLYLTGFISFQYGPSLSESCNAHKHVIGLLHRHGLGRVLEGLIIPSRRDQDKDKDKDTDIGGAGGKRTMPPTVDEVAAFCLERENGIDAQDFVDHYQANGWMRGKSKLKDWKAAVRTWEKNRDKPKGPRLPTPQEDADWVPE